MRLAAVELHNKLGMAIRDQKEKWDLSEADGAYGDDPWPIATFQAILLHMILCFILGNQNGLNLDLKFSLSSTDFGLLETLVRSCRNLGMFHYSNILATCEGPGPRSFVWVCIEEIKRFNLALYKLQFPLPNNTPLWNATGKGEWLAVIKEERFICIDEICQEKWISKSSELLEFLQL
ncbi:hypothetical protein PVAR5_6745 [Paecilomyces variotii No. 5]|uniref:Uncharacterized protein n=1 Tax=Byssochlamys spectabilis (strain No. 5 / NBRC 109023) TaxID=1356009 RepID=V5GAW1_BYSSN|nr:hypothetical protein PVAR5_6745 [Paecilomyces variotii No. 5]